MRYLKNTFRLWLLALTLLLPFSATNAQFKPGAQTKTPGTPGLPMPPIKTDPGGPFWPPSIHGPDGLSWPPKDFGPSGPFKPPIVFSPSVPFPDMCQMCGVVDGGKVHSAFEMPKQLASVETITKCKTNDKFLLKCPPEIPANKYDAFLSNWRLNPDTTSNSSLIHSLVDLTVCWEQTLQDSSMRSKIKRWAEEWTHNTAFKFVGWRSCNNELKAKDAIRVGLVADAFKPPRTMAIGKALLGEPNGILLNLWDDAPWSKVHCGEKGSPERERCQRRTVLHEFGHALAFYHEHTRADAEFIFECPKGGPTGKTEVTEFDPKSIMSYCDKTGSGAPPTELSALDIEGARCLSCLRPLDPKRTCKFKPAFCTALENERTVRNDK